MKLRELKSVRVPPALIALLTLAVLGALFYWRAQQNYLHHDYVNSNFFSFWLSGHMVWTGESPYDANQWSAGFDAYHATYRPSRILQYPLPLMYFLAPIGWLPVGVAYFTWQLVCQVVIALTVVALLRNDPNGQLLVLPATAFLVFFGPVQLSLQVGSVGAISLLALLLTILLLERRLPLFAGITLSVIALKPPQALTILLLSVLWFVLRRQWNVLFGLLLGGGTLLLLWVLRDPLWLVKFRGSSDFLLGHSLGVQSNVFGTAYLACDRRLPCMWVLGAIAAIILACISGWLLWKNHSRWSDWEAFNLIIPVGFLTAVYLWSYDQLLYVIPIVWITAQLVRTSRSYVWGFVFLIVLDLVSFAALLVQAYTKQDMLSLLSTLLVLGPLAWLMSRDTPSTPASPPPAPLPSS